MVLTSETDSFALCLCGTDCIHLDASGFLSTVGRYRVSCVGWLNHAKIFRLRINLGATERRIAAGSSGGSRPAAASITRFRRSGSNSRFVDVHWTISARNGKGRSFRKQVSRSRSQSESKPRDKDSITSNLYWLYWLVFFADQRPRESVEAEPGCFSGAAINGPNYLLRILRRYRFRNNFGVRNRVVKRLVQSALTDIGLRTD